MNIGKWLLAFLFLAIISLLVAGCSGDHDSIPAPGGALTVTTTSLPGATIGTAYSQALAASGGTGATTWSISVGALPAGLSLNGTTGTITGTPTTAGTVNFTVMVTDSATPAGTDTQSLSIVVTAPGAALTVTTASLPGATIGTAYSQALAASGGTGATTWSISVGALPAGLSLNGTTGAIIGTPTTAGTVNFTVMVTDSATPAGTAAQALSIVVSAAGAPLAITTTTLPAATYGAAYIQNLAATGGTTPYTWALTAGALPAGLSLNTATGAISGTPTAPAVPTAATANFSVNVTDAIPGTATASLALTASLSASASAGKTTYDANCAGCHRLGVYDTGGSPDLGTTTLAAINARFSGGASHNGRTMTATQITEMYDFVSLY